jgi:hypothetical protein
MARFITDPSFKVGGERAFLMHEDLGFVSDEYGEQWVRATLDDPFETDFASIPLIVPKWLLNPLGGGLLDKHGHSRLPAVLHDYLCRNATSFAERVEADKIFREAMKARGVRFGRHFMYGAVRANTERMRLMRKWK